MADYASIIDEFQTVANAFTSVNYFIYNRVSEINGRQKDKAYPLILVSSTPNNTRGDINTSYLPRRKEFTFDIFCFNLRNTAQKEAMSLQESQAEVDTILDQYIAEVLRRNVDGSNGFSIVSYEQINGFLAHDVHNDKLVQSKYSFTVRLDSDCNTGTFSY